MPKLSAGLIAYRLTGNRDVEVFLVHPGGPLWKNKDIAAWSIPKGEYMKDEDALTAAKREFTEETGNVAPSGNYLSLRPVKIKSGKVITAWAVQANFEGFIASNNFEMEWPPRSEKRQSFPEADRGEWFAMEDAKNRINTGQLEILVQLEELLAGNHIRDL